MNKPFDINNLKIDEINYENEGDNRIITPSIYRKN